MTLTALSKRHDALSRHEGVLWDGLEATTATTPAGIACKLDLALVTNLDEDVRGMLLAALDDLARLPGGELAAEIAAKRRSEEVADAAPAVALAPVADAAPLASQEELLTRYSCWLAYERRRLVQELYPGWEQAQDWIPLDSHAMAFHFPGPGQTGPVPSSRAVTMLAAAGVYIGPDV